MSLWETLPSPAARAPLELPPLLPLPAEVPIAVFTRADSASTCLLVALASELNLGPLCVIQTQSHSCQEHQEGEFCLPPWAGVIPRQGKVRQHRKPATKVGRVALQALLGYRR